MTRALPQHASTSAKSESLRRVIVLGSTGSIGVNTIDVLHHLNESADEPPFRIVGLAAGRNAERLIEQIEATQPEAVAVADLKAAAAVRDRFPELTVFEGEASSVELIERVEATDVCAAIVGIAGLAATFAAAKLGLRIGLANKETLVAAGALVTPTIRRRGASLIPVDSEHSAIFQCLHGAERSDIKRIVLTASGGPFRAADRQTIEDATVDDALAHPTWQMGRKITVDSATMVNKALEIIEAHWLFGLPGEKIAAIVHPQSVIHSFVEFEDHSVLAQLGYPDMRTPIQYALTYPARPAGCAQALDWQTLSRLDFEPPDPERFPALKLAYEVIEAGGSSGAVFNAANEVAVDAFLNEQIRFGRITEVVAHVMSAIDVQPIDALDTVFEVDRLAREEARRFIDRLLQHE